MTLNWRLAFTIYQLAASAALLPLSYWLWLRTLNHLHWPALFIIAVPVVFGYVVPGIGTNILKLWEFKAGLRIGRFTVLHGCMFGGASSFLAWLCSGLLIGPPGWLAFAKAAVVMASVIGFWNWVFDYVAISKGIAVIYNKPFILGSGNHAVVADYAPVFFGVFGACYGLSISLAATVTQPFGMRMVWAPAAVCAGIGTLVLPIVAHVLSSYVRHGYAGLRPYKRM
jgi:hypothetical protein